MYNDNDQWKIDLAENKDLAGYNNQFLYWLVCIGVYSRVCWIELLKKKKSSKNVVNKFDKILRKEMLPPE